MRAGFCVAVGLVGLTAACGGGGAPAGGPDGGGPSGYYVDVAGYPGAVPVKVSDAGLVTSIELHSVALAPL